MRMVKMPKDTVKEFLMPYYFERLETNKRYSLKKFACDLGISSGRLSTLLNSDNIPTLRVLDRIRKALSLTEREYECLLLTAEAMKKNRTQESVDLLVKDRGYSLLESWIPFAVISMMKTKDFQMDSAYIAARLGIDTGQAEAVIGQLKELGLVVLGPDGWESRPRTIGTTSDQPSEAIRAFHLDKLKLASQKISSVPVELRDYSSITFPANVVSMIEVKKMLIQFRRKVAEMMQKEEPNDVYCLNIQLFPLTVRNVHEE